MVRLPSSVSSEPSGYIACVPASGLAIERESIKAANASFCLVLPIIFVKIVPYTTVGAPGDLRRDQTNQLPCITK